MAVAGLLAQYLAIKNQITECEQQKIRWDNMQTAMSKKLSEQENWSYRKWKLGTDCRKMYHFTFWRKQGHNFLPEQSYDKIGTNGRQRKATRDACRRNSCLISQKKEARSTNEPLKRERKAKTTQKSLSAKMKHQRLKKLQIFSVTFGKRCFEPSNFSA